MNVQVTSVSKRTQKLADAAAAIFVDNAKRTSAARAPPAFRKALRMVPGLQVARIDENKWGHQLAWIQMVASPTNCWCSSTAGVSTTPLFSGVYWNIQDVMLEDVDRIEVIRGPGATLWGANAVNGVN